ncbi:AAA family ATPase [Kitasatospora sp. NPDC092948]|uniref:helix-turn-helix transcriptional regulator n=1 Tax=Kitasatospora sp. NPDC092948 TaxID=3364088 RepID=UPI003818FD5D
MVVSVTTAGAAVEVRQSELAALARAITAAREGRSATVWLSGEPGAGKTRLLGLLAGQARRHGVIVGRGLGVERKPAPYHAFCQALTAAHELLAGATGGVLPDLRAELQRLGSEPELISPVAARRLLAGFASAAPGGLLLLLDDFHGADRASVDLMNLMAHQPVVGGLVLVISYRPRQARAALRAAARLGLELGTADELPLAPMTLEQSSALLGESATDSRAIRLHELAHGNPLYLAALANRPATDSYGAAAPAPYEGLRNCVLAEIAPLSRQAQRAAWAASVLGEVFDVDSVAAVAELPRSEACRALGELRRCDLVRPAVQTGQLVFRHPLLRDYLYVDADGCSRTDAHRRALVHLGAVGAGPMELAAHVMGSGPLMTPADRPVLVAGIRAALAAGRSAQAGWWTVAALRLGRAAAGSADHERCALWQPVVQALAADGRVAQLTDMTAEILSALAAAPVADRVSATVWLATVQAALGRIEDGRVLLAGALAETAGHPELRALIQVQIQLCRVLGGQLPSSTEVEALVRETAGADLVTVGGCLCLRGLCSVFAGDLQAAAEALEAGRRLLDTAEPHGLTGVGYASFLTVLASAESALGRYTAAAAHAGRALAEVQLRGDRHLLPVLLNVQAYVAYQQGRMVEALAAAKAAGDGAGTVARTDQVLLANALTAAAWGWLNTSSDTMESQLADEALAYRSDVATPRATVAAMLFAEAALAAGDGATALTLLLPTPGRRVQKPNAVLAARVYELLTSAALAVGEPAEGWVRRAEAAAEVVGLAEQTGYALLARGHLQAARGRSDDAARSYGEAQRLLGGSAAGVRAEELALAADGAGRYGQPAELRSLTCREREVAELAGEGLRTRDIAHMLDLSPRTVDVHLARIYRKIGVSSRAGLVRLMAVLRAVS